VTTGSAVNGTTLVSCGFEFTLASDGGGGLYVSGGGVALTGCTFYGNETLKRGGGFFVDASSEVTFTTCTIDSNVSASGYEGGGGTVFAVADFFDCTFERNLGWLGAGLGVHDDANVELTDCLFYQNDASNQGGGLWADGTATLPNFADLTRCTFLENVARNSGQVNAGGAICVWTDNTVNLTDCVIARNRAPGTGGSAIGQQGASSTVNVTRCTIADNQSNGGGSLNSRGAGAVINVDRSIVWGDSLAETAKCYDLTGFGQINFTCSDAFGNLVGNWTDCVAGQDSTNGNLEADPLFCDPAGADYSLQVGSPCRLPNSPCGRMGAFTATCATVRTEPTSWGSLKLKF
jgi:hypothetical protein